MENVPDGTEANSIMERYVVAKDRNDFDFELMCDSQPYTVENMNILEDEIEYLNSALFGLTSHFAQIQFRLRQIVNASPDERENLLKSLEEFAFRGIPDIDSVKIRMNEANFLEATRMKQNQQKELIAKLKSQLKELEQYAYENGEAGVPQDVLLERQKVILNELKRRINLNLNEYDLQMSSECVKHKVNVALDQVINPLKIKEHLVTQLKTQVADLERFIIYLQEDSKKRQKCNCGCSYHSVKKNFRCESKISVIQRTATILQMFAALQLGNSFKTFLRKNDTKNNAKIYHWGDLRAKLEMAISRVKELVETNEDNRINETYKHFSDNQIAYRDFQLVTAVRRYLASCIQELMEHGSCLNQNTSLVPFIGCFPRKETISDVKIHAWEIILEYYHLKNGEKYNSTPARKLAESFNLDVAGASPNSIKLNMLSTIGSIMATHTPYKRSFDTQFKAFICAALNANKLAAWLNLIFTCNQLIKQHYLPWSYVAKTRFQDSLKSLDSLTKFKFNLPVDLAVQHFQNMTDMFT